MCYEPEPEPTAWIEWLGLAVLLLVIVGVAVAGIVYAVRAW